VITTKDVVFQINSTIDKTWRERGGVLKTRGKGESVCENRGTEIGLDEEVRSRETSRKKRTIESWSRGLGPLNGRKVLLMKNGL